MSKLKTTPRECIYLKTIYLAAERCWSHVCSRLVASVAETHAAERCWHHVCSRRPASVAETLVAERWGGHVAAEQLWNNENGFYLYYVLNSLLPTNANNNDILRKLCQFLIEYASSEKGIVVTSLILPIRIYITEIYYLGK